MKDGPLQPRFLLTAALFLWCSSRALAAPPESPRRDLQISGVYPHLTTYGIYSQDGAHYKPRETITHDFPAAFSAHWIRFVSDQDCTATATLTYE